MDNSQDQTVINKAAIALVASQIYVLDAQKETANWARDARYSIDAAEHFIRALSDDGYDPGALLTSGGLL